MEKHDHHGAGWVGGLQQRVVDWYAKYGRDFPWRKTSNPYYILVAEVLLRRTQADRVVGPYLEFTAKYPTMGDLAAADVACLRDWFKPLGLVNRADRLVEAARVTVEQHGGELPQSLNQLIGLPGLGEYSARAVLCTAYGAPVPMVDESSGRLLRRLLGLSSVRPAYSDKKLRAQAEKLIPAETGKAFNLGLLDIAAALCRMSAPECVHCPLRMFCNWAKQVEVGQGEASVYARA